MCCVGLGWVGAVGGRVGAIWPWPPASLNDAAWDEEDEEDEEGRGRERGVGRERVRARERGLLAMSIQSARGRSWRDTPHLPTPHPRHHPRTSTCQGYGGHGLTRLYVGGRRTS